MYWKRKEKPKPITVVTGSAGAVSDIGRRPLGRPRTISAMDNRNIAGGMILKAE